MVTGGTEACSTELNDFFFFFTIALEEVGSVNLTIQFVSKKENVYTMPERISPWVRDQHTDGKWIILVPCLYLQENSKPMTGTGSGLGFVYQVNDTVKGLKQTVFINLSYQVILFLIKDTI